MSKVRVLIIDDSALVRQMLTSILSSDEGIEVVGTAGDPLIAREKIKTLNPDVLTLDVEMPRMDGITFLQNLMRLRPMPVVMISSLTENGAEITLNALGLGAVDFVSKPKIDVKQGLQGYANDIIDKVKAASVARVQRLERPVRAASPRHSADVILPPVTGGLKFKATERIIAVGASTGGTEAIKELLARMPSDSPGMVITQHIPEEFSAPFARRMDRISDMNVCEAEHGQYILPGHAYIAPGSRHLMVKRDGARYRCQLSDGAPVNRHRPSVEVLFRCVAQNVGPNAVGIMLTGMGKDGALGLLEMRHAGAHTIAQDENTSVVWGMPGEAVKQGAVMDVLPLQEVAPHLIRIYRGRDK